MLGRVLVTVLLFVSTCGIAAQEAPPPTPTEKQFGADTVHFSVLSTSFLSPEVAQSYGIVRGADKFLINVAVQRRLPEGTQAVRALVQGSSSDLIHRQVLDFREVIEQQAIYYIASFEIDNTEQRDFRLQVTAEGNTQSYDINFNKKLYVDE